MANGEASGTQLPFAASASGGLRLAIADDLIAQYIRIYVGDWENDNPYNQDGGISPAVIFQNAEDPSWKGIVRRRVEELFRRFLTRSNLAEFRGIRFGQTEEGESNMEVTYRSIESDEELVVAVSFGQG